MSIEIDIEKWQKRIEKSRDRREQYEDLWAEYAKLHTNLHMAIKEANDDPFITLPSGDQVRVHLVHRNLEQTFAQLDVADITVRATAQEWLRKMDVEDTHRESVVQTGLRHSMWQSGLFTRQCSSEAVKRDAVIIGHGINFTYWDSREQEVLKTVPLLVEAGVDAAGNTLLVQDTDDEGQPKFDTEEVTETIYEGVGDEHVPVKEFLFDHTAASISGSCWHGREQVVSLDELRQNPALKIPEKLQGATFKPENLYGDSFDEDDADYTNAVKLITIYDKTSKILYRFIEASSVQFEDAHERETWFSSIKRKIKGAKIVESVLGASDKTLIPVAIAQFPVKFDHPDDSPFSALVPIPANDLPYGISQVEHIRNTAREADKIRTRLANITRQLKRLLWYRKGRGISQAQIDEALKQPHGAAIGFDIQEDEDPKNLLGELQMPSAQADLYRMYPTLEDDVRKTSGVADIPQAGASTATESEHIYQIGSARPKRKHNFYMKFLTDIAYKHKAFLRQFSPAGQRLMVPQANGKKLRIEYGRQAFDGRFEIRVMPGNGAIPLSPVEAKTQMEVTGMLLGRYGPGFDQILLREQLTKIDFRNVDDLVAAIPVQQMTPGPGGQRPALDKPEDVGPGQTIRAAINRRNESRQ